MRTQIFLIDDTVSIDDEGHHSRRSVFRRISYKGEAAGHRTVDQIILRPPGRMTSLSIEDAVIVAVKW